MKTLSIFILITGLLISGFVVAETSTDISYPIDELGNCESRTACKEYCDEPSHTEECLEFAEERKMMTKEEITQARTMVRAIREGGPGSCQSKAECQTYCEDTDHLEECIAFAEEYDFIPEKELEKIKAMAEAKRRGVTPPGNCQTKTECEAYCEEVNHIEECLDYAEEAGFIPPGDVEKARQAVRLMKLGKTLGGCQSKAECEAYCESGNHPEECINFAVETGEMTEEEAKRIKEGGPEGIASGGPKKAGPGGCQSEEECEKYCNEHQRECLIFAKENGLMTEEETKMIEQDLTQLRMGIEEASPEAVECIKNKLGGEAVQKIKNGEYIPGPETGQKINQCMKEHEEKMAQEFANSIKDAPEVVTTCLKEKFGGGKFNDFKNGQLPQNSEEGELIESCFQKAAWMSEQEVEENLDELKQALENASPELIDCLNRIESNFAEKVKSGEYVPAPEQEEEVFQCFEQYGPEKPEDEEGKKEKSEEEIIQGILDKVPAEARDCVRDNLTQGIIDKIKTSESPEEELKPIMEECVGPMELDKKEPPEDTKQKPTKEEMSDEKMSEDKEPPPEDTKSQPDEK